MSSDIMFCSNENKNGLNDQFLRRIKKTIALYSNIKYSTKQRSIFYSYLKILIIKYLNSIRLKITLYSML